jgi:tRNA(fMet)-specific endonuclease VapC
MLADRGTPIGEFDVLIAAHAVTLRCTLVTNNVRHFARVPGLAVENWV